MIRRTLVALLLVAAPVSAFAQNDIGLWLNSSKFQSTSFTDQGGTARIKFDSKMGYGVSFNHFSGPNMSTEFAWNSLKADVNGELSFGNSTERARIGDFKANQLSAIIKWHFMPRTFIVPYVGAGVAYHSGAKIKTVNDPTIGETGETFDLESKFGYILNGGVNFNVTRGIAIGLDLKHAPYRGREKGTNDPTGDVKLDPTTVALGVRIRL